jgi:hypothetical protein
MENSKFASKLIKKVCISTTLYNHNENGTGEEEKYSTHANLQPMQLLTPAENTRRFPYTPTDGMSLFLGENHLSGLNKSAS